ncbi:MAG TPA: hypothetical protein PKW80_05530 [Bacteroidales bacterium]|nr:hypothetical protein [Bacteroidales bacterium]
MNAFLWFLLIVFISWFLFIYILPFFVRLYLKRLHGKFEKQAEQQERSKKEEGTINIDYIPENENKSDKEAPGEYVDYEEIDDK